MHACAVLVSKACIFFFFQMSNFFGLRGVVVHLTTLAELASGPVSFLASGLMIWLMSGLVSWPVS